MSTILALSLLIASPESINPEPDLIEQRTQARYEVDFGNTLMATGGALALGSMFTALYYTLEAPPESAIDRHIRGSCHFAAMAFGTGLIWVGLLNRKYGEDHLEEAKAGE